MRSLACAALFAIVPVMVYGQQPASPPPNPPRLLTPAAEVTAMIERARKERRPDQPNFTQPILAFAPYAANLEYRVAGLNAPANVHEGDAEMFYVIEGAGTLVTGGTLREERRTNPANLSGTGIDNGERRRVAKGDFVMVPPQTPHWFGEIDGALVLMSVHLPMPAAK